MKNMIEIAAMALLAGALFSAGSGIAPAATAESLKESAAAVSGTALSEPASGSELPGEDRILTQYECAGEGCRKLKPARPAR